MIEHHGQHARCRACGTNPRGREPEPVVPPSPAESMPVFTADEWTPAPPEVRAQARERIAQIRQSLTKEQSA